MSRFLYNYQTIVRFDAPIRNHVFRLRCVPGESACQRRVRSDLYVYPGVQLQHDCDVWGNGVQYGSLLEPHTSLVYVSSGEVELAPYRIPERAVCPVYRTTTRQTGLSAPMRAFAREQGGEGTPLCVACRLSQAVAAYMAYRPGSTTNATTAAAAFAQREGVCQDYAHILIALCRSRGIVARYASGFIDGIGETHAWVEVYDGTAWTGIDPTHNRRIEDGYIKVAHGRDETDCPVSRGVFTGIANQQTEIRIIVERI